MASGSQRWVHQLLEEEHHKQKGWMDSFVRSNHGRVVLNRTWCPPEGGGGGGGWYLPGSMWFQLTRRMKKFKRIEQQNFGQPLETLKCLYQICTMGIQHNSENNWQFWTHVLPSGLHNPWPRGWLILSCVTINRSSRQSGEFANHVGCNPFISILDPLGKMREHMKTGLSHQIRRNHKTVWWLSMSCSIHQLLATSKNIPHRRLSRDEGLLRRWFWQPKLHWLSLGDRWWHPCFFAKRNHIIG